MPAGEVKEEEGKQKGPVVWAATGNEPPNQKEVLAFALLVAKEFVGCDTALNRWVGQVRRLRPVYEAQGIAVLREALAGDLAGDGSVKLPELINMIAAAVEMPGRAAGDLDAVASAMARWSGPEKQCGLDGQEQGEANGRRRWPPP